MWQILLAHPNYETGGARQSAVAAQPMHVWRVCQLKSGFKYPDHSKKMHFLMGAGQIEDTGSLQSQIFLF